MASSKDIADLASLLKTERQLARKEQRAVAHARTEQQKTSQVAGTETMRFADYFKPWSEYKAPDPVDVALFREAVKDAAPL